MQVERSAFYKPEEILNQVERRIKKVRNVGESIDYLTFVPDGEPTLDINLGVEIELLRQFEIKTAVITNASLIWLQDVRQELAKANWVSLKIDSTCEEI
jgi:wyosine [tRNA(Phe)-imidazoG37] synthetase (radical SAM superfamily)